MLKKFLVVALFACVALNGIAQTEESAIEKEKIQILDLYHINPDKTNISMQHYKNEEYGFSFAVPEKITKNIKVKTKISYTLFAAMEEFFSLIVARLSLKLKI